MLALAPIRRRAYYLFYYAHLVLPLLVCASLVHSWEAWQFSTAGLLLYALDKLEVRTP